MADPNKIAAYAELLRAHAEILRDLAGDLREAAEKNPPLRMDLELCAFRVKNRCGAIADAMSMIDGEMGDA